MKDYKASQMARAAAAAAIQAVNPHLVPISACKGGALIAASKNMKIELGRAFPGVKFAIRTSRYSGGDSITVAWVDGPVTKQVEEIIKRYQGGSFNGMEDIYEYSRDAWIEAFGDAKYVFAERRMSDESIAKAIRLVCSQQQIPEGVEVTVEAYRKGSLWSIPMGWGAPGRANVQDFISEAAYRQCYAMTKPYIAKQVEECA